MSASVNDVLLHPDALHCLKRKQLENLCVRFELKATGKKDELVARLEGYALGKGMQTDTYTGGSFVQAPLTRSRSASRTSISSLTLFDSKENAGVPSKIQSAKYMGEDSMEEEEGFPRGPSIRLITKAEEGTGDEVEDEIAHSESSRTVLAEASTNVTEQLPSSSSSKSIYPWKRIVSSSSFSRAKRNNSSSFTLSSQPAAATSDEPMTMDEFGNGERKISTERKSSFGSLKRLLSLRSASSLVDADAQHTSNASETPPAVTCISSPAGKRKREEDQDEEGDKGDEVPEQPVRRAIKPRPSRARKSRVNTALAVLIPGSPASSNQVDFSASASKILEEMNARLQENGKATMTRLPSPGAWSVSTGTKPPASPLKSVNSRTKGRFSNEHEKQFGQMASIASHYAAKRIESAGKEWAASNSKRIKIEEPKISVAAVKTAEEKAVVQRKLELARQRRKSAGRRASVGRKSTTATATTARLGFRSKISGAVRDFVVGAARGKVSETAESDQAPRRVPAVSSVEKKNTSTSILKQPADLSRKGSSVVLNAAVKSRPPVFDLKASLARKPIGYKPYSAKETVQMLQNAAPPSVSPSKTKDGFVVPSPIRSGWTMVSSTPTTVSSVGKRIPSSSSTIAFPSISPRKQSLMAAPSETKSHTVEAVRVVAGPSAIEEERVAQEKDRASVSPGLSRGLRRNTIQATPARKTRSSISTGYRAPTQADRLRRAAKVNEVKHQASMAARRRNEAAVQRAVERGQHTAKATTAAVVYSGSGRGSPRKASGTILMTGEGRGSPAIKRMDQLR